MKKKKKKAGRQKAAGSRQEKATVNDTTLPATIPPVIDGVIIPPVDKVVFNAQFKYLPTSKPVRFAANGEAEIILLVDPEDRAAVMTLLEKQEECPVFRVEVVFE